MPFFCTKYRISRFSLSTGIPVVRKVPENFPNDDDDEEEEEGDEAEEEEEEEEDEEKTMKKKKTITKSDARTR